MDFLYGLAFELLLKLLFDKPDIHIHMPEPPPPRSVQVLTVEAPQLINIPEWVTQTPKDSFVGISRPCESIEEARQNALHSAVSQILQALGAEYSLDHKSILSGNAQNSHHELKERLLYTAKWFIQSVQEGIKKTDIQQIKEKYICFVLIDFPSAKIERLRKLATGPKVGAKIIDETDDHLLVEAVENNGVLVTLTDYAINVATRHLHAPVIRMFAWKVPESSTQDFGGVFAQRICLKESSRRFSIRKLRLDANLKSCLLGAESRTRITLHGYDETGRPLSLQVSGLH